MLSHNVSDWSRGRSQGLLQRLKPTGGAVRTSVGGKPRLAFWQWTRTDFVWSKVCTLSFFFRLLIGQYYCRLGWGYIAPCWFLWGTCPGVTLPLNAGFSSTEQTHISGNNELQTWQEVTRALLLTFACLAVIVSLQTFLVTDSDFWICVRIFTYI